MHLRREKQPTERDLAALADGSLAPERRPRVERAVAASPELQADLREQRQALTAIHAAATESAPAALRARVALARPERSRRRPRRRLGAFAVAATAVLAAAVVLTLGGGSSTAPSVADAAAFGMRPAVASVPAPPPGAATLQRPQGPGVPFPNWQKHFGWHAIGTRHDRVGGRPATTVFYWHQGHTVAYTIVGGKPLPVGSPARVAVRNGTELRTLAVGGRPVVTWLRRGHTCVLSGAQTDTATLLRLAAWRGGGQIPS